MNIEQARQRQRDHLAKVDKMLGVVRTHPPSNRYLDQRIHDEKMVIDDEQRQYNELKNRKEIKWTPYR